MAELGVKRRIHDVEMPVHAPATALCRDRALRARRGSVGIVEGVDLDAVLRSGAGGPQGYAARCAVVQSLGMTVESAALMYCALGRTERQFLMTLDLNALQGNLSRLFADMDARGLPFHSINVKTVSISFHANRAWLLETCFRRVEDANCHRLVQIAMERLFADSPRLSLSIMYGGGVRDVLLADWCRAYGLTANRWQKPTIVVMTAENGRSFFVPACCF